METGYIYLIREREYVRTKEEVTKAGRTGDIMRRIVCGRLQRERI